MADRRVEDVQKRLNHEREDTARRIAAAINTEREVHTHTHTSQCRDRATLLMKACGGVGSEPTLSGKRGSTDK